eukprot:scaffold27835_cov122-Isochrysis_galbana.AAC.3
MERSSLSGPPQTTHKAPAPPRRPRSISRQAPRACWGGCTATQHGANHAVDQPSFTPYTRRVACPARVGVSPPSPRLSLVTTGARLAMPATLAKPGDGAAAESWRSISAAASASGASAG